MPDEQKPKDTAKPPDDALPQKARAPRPEPKYETKKFVAVLMDENGHKRRTTQRVQVQVG